MSNPHPHQVVLHKYAVYCDPNAVAAVNNAAMAIAPLLQDWTRHAEYMRFLEQEFETLTREFNSYDDAQEKKAKVHLSALDMLGVMMKAAIASNNAEVVSRLADSFDNLVNHTPNLTNEATIFVVTRREAAQTGRPFITPE